MRPEANEAAALAQRAVESFKAAARKGFLRGESEAKGSQVASVCGLKLLVCDVLRY